MKTATWFHCKITPIQRSKGRLAIDVAAYHYRTKFYNKELRVWTKDYASHGGLEATFIRTKNGSPIYNAEELWNEAMRNDRRSNSRTARDLIVSLYRNDTLEGREKCAGEIADYLVERYGVAVSIALHEPDESDNYHAHFLFTTRRVDKDGFGAKTRELDDQKTGRQEIKNIREAVANIINNHMESLGVDEQITHLSYEERGIDKLATKHMGAYANKLEKEGIQTRIGDENRAITEHNLEMERLERELTFVQAEREEFEQSSKSWEEQKQAAQSPENSTTLASFTRDIEEEGEVRSIMENWYHRTASLFGRIYERAQTIVKDIWQKYNERESIDMER